MKKRLISFLLVFVMMFSFVTSMAFAEKTDGGSTSVVASEFDDVKKTDWYYNSVKYANEKGFFSGTGNGKFSPD